MNAHSSSSCHSGKLLWHQVAHAAAGPSGIHATAGPNDLHATAGPSGIIPSVFDTDQCIIYTKIVIQPKPNPKMVRYF